MLKHLTALLLLFAALPASAHDAKVWEAWKERGGKAKARVEELMKKGAVSPSQSLLSPQETCELKLENAFAKFAKPEAETVLKGHAMGFDGYSLLIDTNDTKAWSQLTVMYPPNKKDPFGYAAVKLAEGWSFVAAGKDGVWIEGEGCRFIFEQKKPLAPVVHAIKAEKAAK